MNQKKAKQIRRNAKKIAAQLNVTERKAVKMIKGLVKNV
jgi:hypothetical protein